MHDEHREATRRRFDEVAGTYDTRFVRFIDRYDEMHAVMMALIRHRAPGARRVLDLGTGTGEIARRILEADPDVRVHGVDFSEEMLRGARAKLARFGARFTTESGDLANWSPAAGDPFDVVISALAIHHLQDDAKADLTRRMAGALRPAGLFLNGDLVRGETDAEQACLEAMHLDMMRQRGLSEEECRDRMERHRIHDIPARLSDQIRWLVEAGFREAWAPWRHLTQAVVFGVR